MQIKLKEIYIFRNILPWKKRVLILMIQMYSVK